MLRETVAMAEDTGRNENIFPLIDAGLRAAKAIRHARRRQVTS